MRCILTTMKVKVKVKNDEEVKHIVRPLYEVHSLHHEELDNLPRFKCFFWAKNAVNTYFFAFCKYDSHHSGELDSHPRF